MSTWPRSCLFSAFLSTTALQAAELPGVFSERPAVEFTLGIDRLTNQYAQWSHQAVDVVLPMKEQGLLYVEGMSAHRYGAQDQDLYGAYSLPFEQGTLSVEGGYATPAQFLARSLYGVNWNGRLPQGFGFSIAFRQRYYSTSSAEAYGLGLEKYLGDFRVALGGTRSTLNHQQPQWSMHAQIQWMRERSRWGFTFATGLEPEMVALGSLASVRTELYQVENVTPLSSDVSLVAALWHAKQGYHFERNGGQIGLRMAF
jgi:YaiO family outer membrane protein